MAEIRGPVGRVLGFAVRLWTTPVLRFRVRDGSFGIDLLPDLQEVGSVDERIKYIDQARENLFAALAAVDELKDSAEQNKKELQIALDQISKARSDKTEAENELQNVRKIAQVDVNTFKTLAGIPSRKQIAWERLIGFVLGVAASLIATLLWSGLKTK